MARTPIRSSFPSLLLAFAGACTGAVQSGEQGNPDISNGNSPTRPGQPQKPPPGGAVTPTPGAAGPRTLHRLTRREYLNTIRDLLGEANVPASLSLPGDAMGEGGFPVGAIVSTNDASSLMDAAEAIGAKLGSRVTELAACNSADDACARTFAGSFGRRAYRRPLTPGELDAHVALYKSARETLKLDHPGALRVVLQAMLQSSSFLYHWEAGPGAPSRDGSLLRLGPHELASRLSYFLWSTMPDNALFTAADTGALATPGELDRQARRMLADRRARETVASFHHEWLRLGELESLQRNSPDFDASVARAMGDELAAFTGHVVFEAGGKLETLLTAPFTVAGAPVAKLYGVTTTAVRKLDLDPAQRSGLLTQTAFLAAHATGSGSHPVRRGVHVLQALLCVDPPPVPDNVPDPKPAANNVSTRERFAEHSRNECASGCHALIDPLGFAFEHYDAVGKFRATDGGKPVDASGNYKLPSGRDIRFSNAVDLTRQLAQADEVRSCVARQWLRFALGRADLPADEVTVRDVNAAFAGSGYDLRELLVAVVKSRSFTTRAPSAGEVLP